MYLFKPAVRGRHTSHKRRRGQAPTLTAQIQWDPIRFPVIWRLLDPLP